MSALSYSKTLVGKTVENVGDVQTMLNEVKAVVNALDDANMKSGAGIDWAKMASGSPAQLPIIQAGGLAALKALSGDVTIAADGTVSIGNSKVTGAMLAASALRVVSGMYRTIAFADGYLWDQGGGGGNPPSVLYNLGSTGGSLFGMVSNATAAETKVAPPRVFAVVAADHAIAGLVSKLRLRAEVVTNGTAPACNFLFGLYPFTAGGGSDALSWSAGAIVPSSGVTIAAPPAGSQSVQVSADFDLPADGAYLLAVTPSAQFANNAAVSCHAQLQVHNV